MGFPELWLIFVHSLAFARSLLRLPDGDINWGTGGIKPDVRLIGKVEGKSLFAIHNPKFKLNWHQAGGVCVEMSWRLAEITSLKQNEMIEEAAKSKQIITAEYWVGGRDAWEPRQFSWNSSQTPVTDGGLQFIGRDVYFYLTCVTYHPKLEWPKQKLTYRPCNDLLSHFMCETYQK